MTDEKEMPNLPLRLIYERYEKSAAVSKEKRQKAETKRNIKKVLLFVLLIVLLAIAAYVVFFM